MQGFFCWYVFLGEDDLLSITFDVEKFCLSALIFRYLDIVQ